MNGNGNGFNYDFGIAIARGTVRQLALLSGATLSVTAAIYGLISTANQYDETLKNSRVAFGGYTNAIKAMAFAQQKLLDGKSYFDTDDILQGMKELQNLGLDAKKNFDWINDMATYAGKTFTQTSDSIVAAMRGDEAALREFGIPDLVMKQFKKFQGNTTMMRDAVLGFLKNQKQFRNGFNETMVSIPMYFKRMKGFATLFTQAILGKNEDPNSLINAVKHALHQVNEFLKAHQKTIARTGAFIGQILKFIFKTVGEFMAWVFKGAGKMVASLDKFMDNYQHNMMSLLLWLELAKGKVVSLFNEYKDSILLVLKIYALWKATQLGIAATSWVFGVLTAGWDKVAYGIKYVRVMSKKHISDIGKMKDAIVNYATDSWGLLKGFYRRWVAQIGYLKAGNTAAMNSFTKSLWNVNIRAKALVAQLRLMATASYWQGLRVRAVTSLTSMWQSLVAGATAAGVYVAELWAMSVAALAGVVPAMTGAAASAWAFTVALLANPVTWIVIGVVALAAAVFLLIRHFYGTKTAIATFIDMAILAIAAVFPMIGLVLLIIRYWSKFKVMFINVWHTVTNVAKLAWLKLKDYANQFVDWISNKFSFLGKIFDPIVNAFKTVGTWVKSLGNGPLGYLLDKIVSLTSNMADATGAALAAEQSKRGLTVTADYGQKEAVESASTPKPTTPEQKKMTPADRKGMDMLPKSMRDFGKNAQMPDTARNGMSSDSMSAPITINVYAAQNQSVDQIATAVAKKLEESKRTKSQRQGHTE